MGGNGASITALDEVLTGAPDFLVVVVVEKVGLAMDFRMDLLLGGDAAILRYDGTRVAEKDDGAGVVVLGNGAAEREENRLGDLYELGVWEALDGSAKDPKEVNA